MIPLAIFESRVSNSIWCRTWILRSPILPYQLPNQCLPTIGWSIEDALILDITSLRKETFQELKFDSCGQGSNSNFSASATDRVSDKVVDIDGLCSHGLSSAGRNVGNGESTFSVGENGCEQSIPDAGRMNKWVMRGVRLPAILFVLCSATSLVSYCFGFLGSTNCRCLRHFILMRNRQLLCADNSLPLTVWGFLENFPSDTSSWAPQFATGCAIRSCWDSRSCRIFDNLQCVTVALSASGFSRTLFSLSPAWKRTSCSCNIWLLWPHGASRASDPIICATLLLFSSIRPLHRFWIPLNYHIIVNSKFSEGSLTAWFTAFLPCHWFSRTAIVNWWFWQKKITNVSFHGFKFAACHFFRIFVSDASLLYLIPFSRLCIKKKCWKWTAHRIASPFLTSKFLPVIEFALGLITCEKCVSSVTTHPTSVWCAQCMCGMDTHDFAFRELPSQYARRQQSVNHRVPRMSVRRKHKAETSTTEGWRQTLKSWLEQCCCEAHLNWRCQKTSAACAVWVLSVHVILNHLSAYRRELSGCFITFRKFLVIVFSWRCHLLKRRYTFPCQFAVPLNVLFGMTFHINTPSSDLLQRIFSSCLIFFVSFPCRCALTEQLGFGLNRLRTNLCFSLCATKIHLIDWWRWIFEVDFFLQNFPNGYHILLFFPTISKSSTWTVEHNPSF